MADIQKSVKNHGFRPKKALGQNFIYDEALLADIAACGCQPGDVVLEIGPGPGGLTAALAGRAQKVVAVEIDADIIPILKKNTAGLNVEIIHGDIMTADLKALAAGPLLGQPFRVVANLPYYITTPILMLLLESELEIKSITVMVQKEVAQRIASPPGSREYGALSVAAQLYAQADIPMEVPASAFDPQPDVDSALIRLTMLEQRIVADEELPAFRKVVKAAFSQRRKQLKNTLSPLLGGAQQAAEALISAGIDPSRRAETLSVEEFLALTRAAGKK